MDKVKSQKLKNININDKTKKIFGGCVLFLGVFLLIFNIYASQQISSTYFQLINNRRKAVVDFLKRIKSHSQFGFFLQTNINIFNHYLENEVFDDQRKNEEIIAELESLLQKNPKSRDILYKLYLVNKNLGNNQKAEKYFNLAKEIDPNIRQ